MAKLRKHLGNDHLDLTFKSLPRRIGLMTACSGSGIFELSAKAVADQLNQDFKMQPGLKASL